MQYSMQYSIRSEYTIYTAVLTLACAALQILVPPELGPGSAGSGQDQGQGLVPPGVTLEYELELLRVSIPPS